jgi:hypothetical protein
MNAIGSVCGSSSGETNVTDANAAVTPQAASRIAVSTRRERSVRRTRKRASRGSRKISTTAETTVPRIRHPKATANGNRLMCMTVGTHSSSSAASTKK